MTYELAKQLKNAKFPLKTTNFGPNQKTPIAYFLDGIDSGIGYIPPTLSELIEACGEQFGGLQKRIDKTWSAEPNYGLSMDFDDVVGKTPEEAVARLWLELNKKL